MTEILDPEFWVRLLGIGVLNLLLSGDNALVIALAVRSLPPRQRVLGQVWGALGAVVLRLAFVAAVSLLLKLPFLQLVGGSLLVWIAVKLVRPGEEGGEGTQRHGASFWDAVWIIIVADVTMSLDNVLAIAAAAHGQMLLVVLGIALSLPIVVWGAGLLARLMNRYAWIVWLGGGLLGYVAGEMVVADRVVPRLVGEPVAHLLHRVVPVVVGLLVIAAGWTGSRRSRASAAGVPGHGTP